MAILVVGAIGLGSPSTVVTMLEYIPAINTLSEVMYLPGISVGPSIYLTVVGSVVIVLSFVGCGGAYKRSHHMILVVCIRIAATHPLHHFHPYSMWRGRSVDSLLDSEP